MDSLCNDLGLFSFLQSNTGIGDFVFFKLITDFLDYRIGELSDGIMGRAMAWVSLLALTLLTIHILFVGYQILTGHFRESLSTLVIDLCKKVMIITVAGSMTLFGTPLKTRFAEDMDRAINHLVNGEGAITITQAIDKNLAYMQVALNAIDAVEVVGVDPPLREEKARAALFAGFGTSSPAMSAGAMLISFKFMLGFFIGLGPLFILMLLFKGTQSMFLRWLQFGIATTFAMAGLSAVCSIVLDLTARAAAAFWGAKAVNGILLLDPEGMSSHAMQQGFIGVLLSASIIGVPILLAAFFGGLAGRFLPFSAFGGGAGQRRSHGAPPAAPPPHHSGDGPAPDHLPPMHHRGAEPAQHLDVIKQGSPHHQGDFLERYPHATAGLNGGGGPGDPVPQALQAIAQGQQPHTRQASDQDVQAMQQDIDRLRAQGRDTTMAQQALDELSSRQYVGSSPQHYLETSDQVGAGLEVVGLAAEGLEKIGQAGPIGYGVKLTPPPSWGEYFVNSGGKTFPVSAAAEWYIGPGIKPDMLNTVGSTFDWGKAVPAARFAGTAAAWGGVGIEGLSVIKNTLEGQANAGDYGHWGMSTVMTAIGGTPAGAPVALTWAALDLAAQSYHYTPVYANEYGNVEINGWRAMRATAIDNQERGTRLLMRERPDLFHDEAEALFKARARRMEFGPK
jgi:type IV secretion system protein VirB6